jgi:excisionase family DNA binding protein
MNEVQAKETAVMDNATVQQAKLLLTVNEAAEALSLSRTRLYDLLMRKQIFSVKVGGARRIPLKALHEFVDRLAEGERVR